VSLEPETAPKGRFKEHAPDQCPSFLFFLETGLKGQCGPKRRGNPPRKWFSLKACKVQTI
jgi:hypothetical protein